ncbi:hypothetical protein J7444_02630 [Labrenzia sp. R4_1]|nr:hypothetical protein [Labrenzia sp. R4_1]MBO9423594.1 hypothetical protein [Labrenzia sp. R4_1]
MTRRAASKELPASRLPCLTEMSLPALIGGAAGLSAILWLAILAVL